MATVSERKYLEWSGGGPRRGRAPPAPWWRLQNGVKLILIICLRQEMIDDCALAPPTLHIPRFSSPGTLKSDLVGT